MSEYEAKVIRCLQAWLDKDISPLEELFAPEIVYIESFGPAYRGIGEIRRWFNDWVRMGSMLRWDVKSFLEQGNRCACEWHFECIFGGDFGALDGLSLVEFNDEGRIVSLKEFQARPTLQYPYSWID